MHPTVGYVALGLAAGLLIPVMARLNGTLAAETGSFAWPAIIVTGGAFLGSLAFAAVRLEAPPAALLGKPVYFYVTGLVMAFYVIAITWLVPRFGIAPAIICVVAAQLIAAAAIDQFGLLGAPVRPLDAPRALGIVLLFAGVVLAARPASAAS